MFKNFWYALEFSKAVTPKKPATQRCLMQDVIMTRDASGQVHAHHALRTADEVLPAVDRFGFVWVFLGDPDLPSDQRPPIPDWEEWDDPRFAGHNASGEWHWKANVERVLENGVDVAHTPFVHAGQFGNPQRPQVPDHDILQNAWSAQLQVKLNPPAPKGIYGLLRRERKGLDSRPQVEVSTTWYLPTLIRLKVSLPFGQICLFDSNIPVSPTETHTKFITMRTFFKGRWADANSVKRAIPIFVADARVVEGLRPELLPFDLGAELQLRSDAMTVAYRRRRQEIINDGWDLKPGELLTGWKPGSEGAEPGPNAEAGRLLAMPYDVKEVAA